jgi:S-adenosyl methyltransferase
MSNLAESIPSGQDPSALTSRYALSNGAFPSPDVSLPNVARIYDYLLGGKDNFASDRLAVMELMKVVPDIAMVCHHNRQFLKRVVRFLAGDRNIRQFIDIGAGLPTQGNVHEIAQAIEPNARVLYVDNDPVVVSHAQALLVKAPTVVAINRDLRDPRQIIQHPALQALIDLDKPVAVLLIAILHFIPDGDDPHGIVAELKAAMPAGSYLAISHATGDDVPGEVTGKVREVYSRANASAAPRTRAGITRFFDGLDMIEPGLVNVSAWPARARGPKPARTIFLAGVGRKP